SGRCRAGPARALGGEISRPCAGRAFQETGTAEARRNGASRRSSLSRSTKEVSFLLPARPRRQRRCVLWVLAALEPYGTCRDLPGGRAHASPSDAFDPTGPAI